MITARFRVDVDTRKTQGTGVVGDGCRTDRRTSRRSPKLAPERQSRRLRHHAKACRPSKRRLSLASLPVSENGQGKHSYVRLASWAISLSQRLLAVGARLCRAHDRMVRMIIHMASNTCRSQPWWS